MVGCRTALTLAPLDPEIHFYLGLALEPQARAKGADALAAHLEKLATAFRSGQPWRQ